MLFNLLLKKYKVEIPLLDTVYVRDLQISKHGIWVA